MRASLSPSSTGEDMSSKIYKHKMTFMYSITEISTSTHAHKCIFSVQYSIYNLLSVENSSVPLWKFKQ